MRGAEAERQAKTAPISPLPPARGGGGFMPPPLVFHAGRGTWLISFQYPAEMSGGLDKAAYEKLIHLVSQNRILYDADCFRL